MTKTLVELLKEARENDIPQITNKNVEAINALEVERENILTDCTNAARAEITEFLGNLAEVTNFEVDLRGSADFRMGPFSFSAYSHPAVNSAGDTCKMYDEADMYVRYSNAGHGIHIKGNELPQWSEQYLTPRVLDDIIIAGMIANWLNEDRIRTLFNIVTSHTSNYHMKIRAYNEQIDKLQDNIKEQLKHYVKFTLSYKCYFGMDLFPIIDRIDSRHKPALMPKFNKMTKKFVSVTYVFDGNEFYTPTSPKSKNIKIEDWIKTLSDYLRRDMAF